MSTPQKGRILHFGLAGAPPTVQLPPGTTKANIQEKVNSGADQARAAGYEVQLTFIEVEDFPESLAELKKELATGKWDALVIGGGVRLAVGLTWMFESIVNVSREVAPGTKLLFQMEPGDIYEVVRRGFEGEASV